MHSLALRSKMQGNLSAPGKSRLHQQCGLKAKRTPSMRFKPGSLSTSIKKIGPEISFGPSLQCKINDWAPVQKGLEGCQQK
jgi:hypothetical protein